MHQRLWRICFQSVPPISMCPSHAITPQLSVVARGAVVLLSGEGPSASAGTLPVTRCYSCSSRGSVPAGLPVILVVNGTVGWGRWVQRNMLCPEVPHVLQLLCCPATGATVAPPGSPSAGAAVFWNCGIPHSCHLLPLPPRS
jgi:hypothetical protein